MSMSRRFAAELIGTFWLVFGGCGSAVLAAGFPEDRNRIPGSRARVRPDSAHDGIHDRNDLGMPYQSGGDDRIVGRQAIPWRARSHTYIIAQVIGAILASTVLYVIASGGPGFDLSNGFRRPTATALHSPGGYSMGAAFVAEVRADLHVPDRDSRLDRQACHRRLRTDSDRSRADADSSDQHPGRQHFGESCAQHRSRALRRRMGAVAAMALLGRADRRRRSRRLLLQLVRHPGSDHRRAGPRRQKDRSVALASCAAPVRQQ